MCMMIKYDYRQRIPARGATGAKPARFAMGTFDPSKRTPYMYNAHIQYRAQQRIQRGTDRSSPPTPIDTVPMEDEGGMELSTSSQSALCTRPRKNSLSDPDPSRPAGVNLLMMKKPQQLKPFGCLPPTDLSNTEHAVVLLRSREPQQLSLLPHDSWTHFHGSLTRR